jgi:hypothetical protein
MEMRTQLHGTTAEIETEYFLRAENEVIKRNFKLNKKEIK